MTVRIEGLKEFRAALLRVAKKYGKQMAEANLELADQVVSYARDESHGVSLRTAAKASESLRGISSGASAIVEGGRGAAYFFGAEYGSKRYGQFLSWRGNQFGGWSGGPGYFLHPAIRDHANDLIEAYADKLMELYREAFPD